MSAWNFALFLAHATVDTILKFGSFYTLEQSSYESRSSCSNQWRLNGSQEILELVNAQKNEAGVIA